MDHHTGMHGGKGQSPGEHTPNRHDIFVRAHTVVPQKGRFPRSEPKKWSEYVLIFDTETTVDTAQKLTFGSYRKCQLGSSGYECFEEGLFHADDLVAGQRKLLERYVHDPRNTPGIEAQVFPPQMRLNLYTRSQFVERIFWAAIRQQAIVIGFNLPFDLSRLAVHAGASETGGWSLALSFRKSRKTKQLELNPERPRVVVFSIDSKAAFFGLKAIFRPEEWPREGRFLDLHTLGWALRNESYSLDAACQAFGVPGKLDHKPTGTVSAEEIDYCRQDTRCTSDLLNVMRQDFDRHPIELDPCKSYSPASIAKAYLQAMNIEPAKEKFWVPDEQLGIAMQGYYGGRAECRIRKVPVPVVLTDFTSQYPTVNALLGNWKLLTAQTMKFKDCTVQVGKMLTGLTLKDTFNARFWRTLSFFALVIPDNDILPVRTVYNGRTRNIGVNHLFSEKPIWFAGPDLVASALLGKVPKIIRAIRMLPLGRQWHLKRTNLGGMVAINPRTDDFFRRVIEQRNTLKAKNKPLANFLKILANAGSYGLFVQVDQERRTEPVEVKVFSGEISLERAYATVEKSGDWYFPPMASLITAGGRLLLAMLEKSVELEKGSYLFCDTDSLCIVSSEREELIPCSGGKHKTDDGQEAVKALSWRKVASIARNFNRLNPYKHRLVKELLKIEDINFVDCDPRKPPRQLFGYAISAKRYALYTRTEKDIEIVKASGHGLGYLYPPKDGFNKSADAPDWVVEAWDWLLRQELGLASREPIWLGLPAMMRMALTSPNVMRTHRPEWLAPFNFFFFPLISDLGGYPAGHDRSNFRFIAPFTSERGKWSTLEGINVIDEQPYSMEMVPSGKQDKVVPESFGIILRLYLRHPESKSFRPMGLPAWLTLKDYSGERRLSPARLSRWARKQIGAGSRVRT
jgi:hypothetical protein